MFNFQLNSRMSDETIVTCYATDKAKINKIDM